MHTKYKYGADTKFEESWDDYQPTPHLLGNDLDDFEQKLIEYTKECDVTEGVIWLADRNHECVGSDVHGYPESNIVSVIEGRWESDGSVYSTYWYIFEDIGCVAVVL